MNPVTTYPIDSILPELIDAVRNNPSVVLHAPPGAGKTTRVPLALLDVIASGRIVMLEPRRIAAVSAARWMAQTLHEQPGETVGYAIRFDAKRSAKTRIEVVTEGILTRRIQADPGLDGTSMVIFDEFHERSIHADLALALCLDVRAGLRPDLKIMVMSATLDYGPIAALLGNARVVTSGGRAFPVSERYLDDKTGSLPQRVAQAARIALAETEGDLLVFLPGAREIRASARELQETVSAAETKISIHTLYGDLPFEEQERAIMPSRDARKIVLATNIAETSLTIEGVRTVIDSGLTRMLRFDPNSGMNRLVTISESKASAEQRKGRAGRLGPGSCYRLFGSGSVSSMLPFTQPEITVSDLSQLILELAVWGVKDPKALSWLDVPPAAAWESGVRLLRDLGALDPSGAATALGKAMARLPLHPRLSRLIMRGDELGSIRVSADLSALITERDIFRHGAAGRPVGDPDITERLEALRRGRRWREPEEGTDPAAIRAVEKTSSQLLRLMPRVEKESDAIDHEMVSRLLLSAFPDRVCKRREEIGGGFVHVQGRGVRLSRDSHLGTSPYLIAVNVDAGEKTEGFIHLAAAVTEDLIREECGDRIEVVRRVEWDRKEGRVAAAREERIGSLRLSNRPFTPSDEEAAPVLCEAIRTTSGLISLTNEVRQFQGRIRLMRVSFPEETWPDLSDDWLLSRPEEWLLPWLAGIRTAQKLSNMNILEALRAKLSWEQSRQLDQLAPVFLTVPSGSRVTLDYASGDLPVLAVKLQEMFGLADTPVIAGGRVRVLLHLLSPARRPVQITQDLKGFWNNVYPEVKKDLKGRYPKHPWPEDPWNAVPTRRTKLR